MHKQRHIDEKKLYEHTCKLFTLTQAFPPTLLGLLEKKKRRDLTEKEQKQFADTVRERNMFPLLNNHKNIIDLCNEITLESERAGRSIEETDDLLLILDGAVKIFEESSRHRIGNGGEGLRLSLSAVIFNEQDNKIEKRKLGAGEVILFEKAQPNLIYIVSSAVTLVRIPFEIHSTIALGSFMAETKKRHEFFSKMPLFERHYRSSLQDLLNCLEERTCGFGSKIFSEGEQVTSIYIIKEGEFILQKNICTDDFFIRKGKVVEKQHNRNSNSFLDSQIKNIHKHYRSAPYKIIGTKEILGDCEYLLNNRSYFYSMRCHKEGSKLFVINAETFFKKLYVPENKTDKVQSLLEEKIEERRKQIDAGMKFNKSNVLMVKFMPTSTMRYRTDSEHVSAEKRTSVYQSNERAYTSTQRSYSFFEQMNKTIINQTKGQIRKRFQSKAVEIANEEKLKKIYKTPAVVQEVVHIVNQKKMYHRLRNLGKGNKCAFEFNIDNVPPFIKKKYGRILQHSPN